MKHSLKLVQLGAPLFLCAVALRSQTPADTVIHVEVDLRQVDLVVTDKNGHHVTDLRPEEFQIFQDGRPQKLTNFSWIEVTPPPTGARLAALKKPVSLWEHLSGVSTIAKTPGNDILSSPVANPHKDEIRRTIAFVIANATPPAVDRIRKLVDEELEPSDMVSIRSAARSVVLLPHGMQQTRDSMGIFEQFTNDKRQLDAALYRVVRTCDYIHTCVSDPLGAIRGAIRSLSNVPGRKALVFVGGYNGPVNGVIDLANRAGVVVYVLNPGGVPLKSAFRAELSSLDSDADPVADRLPGRESIVQLAKRTGGSWLLTTPGPDLTTDLNDVLEDLSGYYLLGFYPDQIDADNSPQARARHQIEVKVLRPGLTVHARNAAIGGQGAPADASARPQGRGDVLAQALFSPFTADGIRVHLDPEFTVSPRNPKTGKRSPIVRVRLDVDGRDLTLTNQAKAGYTIVLDMALAVFNEDGSQAGAKSMTFTIDVPPEKAASVGKTSMEYSMEVPVSNAGPYQVRAAIRDQGSGRIGSAYSFLDIPDFNRRRFSLSSLVLSPAGDSRVTGAARPSWNEFEPGTTIGFKSEMIRSKASAAAASPPKVDVEVRLYRGEGPVVDVPPVPAVIEKKAGQSFLLGSVRIPGDLAGNYTMEVIAYDRLEPPKKQAVEQWADFTIIRPPTAN